MIDRTFNSLKYTRTYIGGSKKKENECFKNYDKQDEKGELNWVEYRKTWMTYYDDLLNVIFSWKLLFQKVSYVLAVIGLIELFNNLLFGGIIIGISVIAYLVYHYFKWKQSRELGSYYFVLAIIHGEIERNYNLKLSFNP